jgi:anti-anti-sigma regulatory factor
MAELPGALCWRPSGPLEVGSCGALSAEFESQAGPEALVLVDFSRVDGIGPAGIGLLVALHKRQRGAGGDLILFGIRPKLSRFLDSLGFKGFFSTALDRRSAVEYILGVRRDIFPLAAACPACSSRLGVQAPGRSRCRACKAVLTILPDGTVELG